MKQLVNMYIYCIIDFNKKAAHSTVYILAMYLPVITCTLYNVHLSKSVNI